MEITVVHTLNGVKYKCTLREEKWHIEELNTKSRPTLPEPRDYPGTDRMPRKIFFFLCDRVEYKCTKGEDKWHIEEIDKKPLTTLLEPRRYQEIDIMPEEKEKGITILSDLDKETGLKIACLLLKLDQELRLTKILQSPQVKALLETPEDGFAPT